MEKPKNLFENIGNLTILNFFTYLFPLFLIPHIVNSIGLENYGNILFGLSLMFYFIVLSDFGINLYAPRELAVLKVKKKELYDFVGVILSIKLLLTTFCLLILSILIFFKPFSENIILLFSLFIYVISINFNPIWFFQGMENMRYITILGITSRLITFTLVILFLNSESSILLYPLILGVTNLLFSLIGLYIIHVKYIKINISSDITEINKKIKELFYFFLSRLSVSIYTNSNIFILGLLTGPISAGIYGIADKIYNSILQLYHPITQSLYPYMSNKKDISKFKLIFALTFFINILGLTILLFYGEPILIYIFGETEIIESVKVLRILCFVLFFTVPSVMIGYPLLAALGYPKYPNTSVHFAALFHIIGLLILYISDHFSYISVAYVLIGTQFVDLLYRVYGVYKIGILKKRLS